MAAELFVGPALTLLSVALLIIVAWKLGKGLVLLLINSVVGMIILILLNYLPFVKITINIDRDSLSLLRSMADETGVRAAFRAIRDAEGRLGARAGGALVCAMAPAGQEVIVGVTRDQQFGHAVMFGLGGIFVEVMKDVSFRVAPLSERDAAEMVSEIRGYRALTGLRGKPPADLGALRALLRQVSAFLASNPQIEEMDLNPVIVHERGLSIADARVVLNA